MQNTIDIYKFKDYRQFLEAVLSNRREKNMSYSLRAFARDMEFSVSGLSKALNGQGHLSSKSIDKIADHLRFDPKQHSYFRLLHRLATSTRIEEQRSLASKIKTLRQEALQAKIKQENLQNIGWKHFVTLFLLASDGPGLQVADIAQQISCEIEEIDQIIDDLISHEMLEIQGGRYLPSSSYFQTDSSKKSSDIQRLHLELMNEATKKIQSLATNERYVRSLILTLNRFQYDELVKQIEEFVTDCADDTTTKNEEDTNTYGLSIQLFPLN